MKPAATAGLWTLFAACLLLVPQAVSGQATAEWRGDTYAALDQLHDEAMAPVLSSTTEFSQALAEAAEKHEGVAALRGSDDARTFDCLKKQAFLLHATGDLTDARRHMKRAAEHAEEMGHVYEAAMAYVDAAILARDAGNGIAAAYLASRAERLSSFGFLESQERDRIVNRIAGLSS